MIIISIPALSKKNVNSVLLETLSGKAVRADAAHFPIQIILKSLDTSRSTTKARQKSYITLELIFK